MVIGRSVDSNQIDYPALSQLTLQGFWIAAIYPEYVDIHLWYQIYDHTGQRVKYTSPATTTVYPTKNYNTDGATPIKHVFAGDMTVAAVKGTGPAAQTYFVHADHLTGSNAVTNSAGALEELLDYFPFGNIRLDQKTNSFDEQRKYINQEYDKDTGLNYLNARYYNATIGRFISQDPMFWTIPAELLVFPQQLNSYSYASNNPIAGSDPSGLLTMIIPGTWHKGIFRGRDDWSSSDEAKNFVSAVSQTFNETRQTFVADDPKVWSGADNHRARVKAANNLANYINSYSFAEGEQLNIVGFSHGGSIGFMLSNMVNRKIDNLVSMATPIGAYQPNFDNIGKLVNVYSNDDIVQRWAGSQVKTTTLVGLGICGVCAGVGEVVGWGEFGAADRELDGAINLDASRYTKRLHPFQSHHDIWAKLDIWKELVERHLK
ncbi:MAG: hypothetical protein HY395_01675 [Candidatus Doudnabacteria bacterium]|nr:hypothetical protein [Candidatus Doudnabacteria bacterium]